MYCWKCGKNNDDGAKFCRYCGEDLNPADAESADMTQDLVSGNGNAASVQTGSNASGQAQNASVSGTDGASNAPAPAPKKGKTGILIAVIAALVVVIVILAVVMFSGSGNSGSTEDGVDTTAETTVDETTDTESETSEDANASDADTADTTGTADTQTEETSAARISGSVTGNNLTFSIDQEESFDLNIYYENNSDASFAFGWTSITYIVVTTDSGTYTEELGTEYSVNAMQVYPGESDSFNVYFDDAEGTIQSVEINNICILGDSGQPADTWDPYSSYTIDITYSE